MSSNNVTEKKKPAFYVYAAEQGRDKTRFTKIGAAWNIKEGGLSVQISAVPLDGRLVLFKTDFAE